MGTTWVAAALLTSGSAQAICRCVSTSLIKVLEMDPWPNPDDLMGKWYGKHINIWLVVSQTNENR